METKTFPVVGMMCAACSANVEKHMAGLKGIESVSVSLPSRTALVTYNPEIISPEDMQREVAAIGYDLIVEPDRNSEDIERQAYIDLKRRVWMSWGFAVIVMALAMIPMAVNTSYYQMVITLLGMIICGRQFYVTAWRQLMHRSANMDTLVALSTSISFLFSVFNTIWGEQVWTPRGIENHVYFDSVVMITAFVLTGRLLEERAKGSTASAIRALMGLAPKTAHLVADGVVSEVPIATVRQRDQLEVRTGEKVPVDGTVRDGDVYIDESMISGEPMPVHKEKGDRVLAGTIVKQGTMKMRATEVGDKTVLSNIIRMVREAQASKAPVQRLVDKIALVFVPTVVGISLITFVLWLVIGGTAELPHALLSAVSVLVIACPCALGLATPTALMVGIGKAAENGILIKDATALEQLHRVDSMILDKTGTLTTPLVDFSHGIPSEEIPLEERERLKPHVPSDLVELRRRGIEMYLMSGDKEDAVSYWAGKAGINHWQSRVLPQDKEDLVLRLQSEGHTVAMTGDGINDSQALAAADVSIAMSTGTDVAIETAQVTLMGDRRISDAIRLSECTVRTVRQNLFWAFIYNLICIPLAAGALHGVLDFQITPMYASALMAFSSVSVVLNSLRLKWVKVG